MEIFKIVDGEKVLLTKEEEQLVLDEQARYEAEQAHRPYTQSEVLDIMLKKSINTMSISDEDSLKMKSYYPSFEEIVGQTLPIGFKFIYHQDNLWKVRQEHLVQAHFTPNIDTASLYERIDEKHLGNKYDPIPYSMEMAVEKEKYYVYQDVMYKCIRSSGQPLYATPNSLLGNYFKAL